MSERIAIIDGVRTPFCKANGVMKDIEADDLGAIVVRELIAKTGINPDIVDELIFGNVLQPAHATNIARVLAVKGGLPEHVPAMTVNRNCASGLEAIITACNKIRLKEGNVFIVGGCESMSKFPVLFSDKMREWLMRFSKAKTLKEKCKVLFSLRLNFLAPVVPKISDPLCGLSMGQTAEVLSKEFRITREQQDSFAFRSQQKASQAIKSGRLAQEIVPIPLPPKFGKIQTYDDGPRDNQTQEGLKQLPPIFDKLTGSVTAGTSSQVTDGAVALLLMSESKAKELGLKPLGYINDYDVAALAPSKMGLGPAYAISKLLKKNGKKLADYDLIEINEAFAAQVLAVISALASPEFSKKELQRDTPLGEIDRERLNVNGGAIALGHPLGASGARLVLTLLKELKNRNKKRGIASLCVGGGQGQAISVEVE